MFKKKYQNEIKIVFILYEKNYILKHFVQEKMYVQQNLISVAYSEKFSTSGVFQNMEIKTV